MAHLRHDIEFPPGEIPSRRRASRILHPSPLGYGGGVGGVASTSSIGFQEFFLDSLDARVVVV
jgi:hypothetical protein